MKDGHDPGPLENEPDISKLIKFKPAHNSFRRLQEHYKDSQLLAKKSGSKKHRNSNHASLILNQHPA